MKNLYKRLGKLDDTKPYDTIPILTAEKIQVLSQEIRNIKTVINKIIDKLERREG